MPALWYAVSDDGLLRLRQRTSVFGMGFGGLGVAQSRRGLSREISIPLVIYTKFMNTALSLLIVIALLPVASAQDTALVKKQNVLYAESANPLHTLDVYASPTAKNAPVMFWIHGGGWVTGDKSDVAQKPQFFVDRGFVFVSVNYRLLPKVEMIDIFRDVAKSFRWVHDHIAEYGGEPKRVLVGGHSAGA